MSENSSPETTNQEYRSQLQKVIDYYDKAQKFYETVWYRKALGLHYGFWTSGVSNRDEAILEENKVLANMAGVGSGDRVLDAGCGVAGSGIWLTKNRQARVIGINIVHEQIKRATKLVNKNGVADMTHFAEADYHRLPFSDGSFDVFWSVESIEHSDNVPVFIKESFRVLGEGGRAVIAGTFKGETQATESQKEQLQVGFRAAGAFNDFRSADEVAEEMRKNGYVDVENRVVTDLVMKSAKQMKAMCQLGLPGAKFGRHIGLISQIMEDNTQWGVYQEGLFKAGVTSYNILTARKP